MIKIYTFNDVEDIAEYIDDLEETVIDRTAMLAMFSIAFNFDWKKGFELLEEIEDIREENEDIVQAMYRYMNKKDNLEYVKQVCIKGE